MYLLLSTLVRILFGVCRSKFYLYKSSFLITSGIKIWFLHIDKHLKDLQCLGSKRSEGPCASIAP